MRNKYEALDAAGNTVLKGDHEMYQMNDEVHFTDADGNEIYTVTADKAVDIAADYFLVDSQADEEMVILDNDFSLVQDTWRIRDSEDESVIAEIKSRGAPVTLARKLLAFGTVIPRKYEITDDTGNHIGSIQGQLSFRDEFEIEIEDADAFPTESILTAAMVIDAIQGE